MNYSPCFLITYFMQCVCVWYGINLTGRAGWRGEESRSRTGDPSSAWDVSGRGSWGLLALGWLAAVEGIPPPPFCSSFPPLRESLLEGEFQMPTRKELTSSCRSAFFHIPFTLTRAESSTATVSQPGCRQPKKIIKLYRGQIEPESGE